MTGRSLLPEYAASFIAFSGPLRLIVVFDILGYFVH